MLYTILSVLTVLFLVVAAYYIYDAMYFHKDESTQTDERIEDDAAEGIHPETGLIEGEGLNLVIANCTPCHSAKLITQNRADRDGWKKMIVWMQETQNLWDLGANEDIILDYLARNYPLEDAAAQQRMRRKPLENIEWYELKE